MKGEGRSTESASHTAADAGTDASASQPQLPKSSRGATTRTHRPIRSSDSVRCRAGGRPAVRCSVRPSVRGGSASDSGGSGEDDRSDLSSPPPPFDASTVQLSRPSALGNGDPRMTFRVDAPILLLRPASIHRCAHSEARGSDATGGGLSTAGLSTMAPDPRSGALPAHSTPRPRCQGPQGRPPSAASGVDSTSGRDVAETK